MKPLLVCLVLVGVLTCNHENEFPCSNATSRYNFFVGLYPVALSKRRCTIRCSPTYNQPETLIEYAPIFEKTLGFEGEGPKSRKRKVLSQSQVAALQAKFRNEQAVKVRKLDSETKDTEILSSGETNESQVTKWVKLHKYMQEELNIHDPDEFLVECAVQGHESFPRLSFATAVFHNSKKLFSMMPERSKYRIAIASVLGKVQRQVAGLVQSAWNIKSSYWRKHKDRDYSNSDIFSKGRSVDQRNVVSDVESEAIAAFMCSQLRQKSGCRNDTYYWEDEKQNYYALYQRQDILETVMERIVGESVKYWQHKLAGGVQSILDKNIACYLSKYEHINENSPAYIREEDREYKARSYKCFFKCVDERVRIINGKPTHCDVCMDYKNGDYDAAIKEIQEELRNHKGRNKKKIKADLVKAKRKLAKAQRHLELKEHQRKYIVNEVGAKMPEMMENGVKPIMVYQDFVSTHASDGKKIYVLVWVMEWVEKVDETYWWRRRYIDHVLRKEREDDKSNAAYVIHCWRSSLERGLFKDFDLIIPVSDNGRHFVANELMFFFSCVLTHTIHYHALPPRHAWNRCDGHGGVWLKKIRTVMLEKRVRYNHEFVAILNLLKDTEAISHGGYEIKPLGEFNKITLITGQAEFYFPKEHVGIVATRPFSGESKGGPYYYECLIKNHSYVCHKCMNDEGKLVFKNDCSC